KTAVPQHRRREIKILSANYFCCDWYFCTSSGLMVSIFAPFFNSSALGTLMMSLVSGAAGCAGGGGGGAACTLSSSTSKINVEFGGMPPTVYFWDSNDFAGM